MRQDFKVRFFVVFYKAIDTRRKSVIEGIAELEVSDNRFLSKNNFAKYIRNQSPDLNSIMITGIMELTLDDYSDWIN